MDAIISVVIILVHIITIQQGMVHQQIPSIINNNLALPEEHRALQQQALAFGLSVQLHQHLQQKT
jgi:hypothetical protein